MDDNSKVKLSSSDELALRQFKRNINRRAAYDIDDTPHFNKEYDCWDVHRKDPKNLVVIDTYHFSSEGAANVAITYAKNMRV